MALFDRDDDHVNVSSTTSVLNITPAAVSIEWCQSVSLKIHEILSPRGLAVVC